MGNCLLAYMASGLIDLDQPQRNDLAVNAVQRGLLEPGKTPRRAGRAGDAYRMMMHLRPMWFFDPPSVIPEQIAYISAYAALEEEGLKGLTTLVRREVQAHRATLLVLDGMSAVEARAGIGFEMKRFTYELQTLASATNCAMFLLTTVSGVTSAPETTMVDGLIELRQRPYGGRNECRLVVHKIRGSAYLEEEHAFRITHDGFTVFPRIESLFSLPTRRDPPPGTRISSGIASLDPMLGGGIPAATMTALVGPSGAGKTTLGLHRLNCLEQVRLRAPAFGDVLHDDQSAALRVDADDLGGHQTVDMLPDADCAFTSRLRTLPAAMRVRSK
jgi:KaiC/GvpD/RAD55 family RecA-like ATPase